MWGCPRRGILLWRLSVTFVLPNLVTVGKIQLNNLKIRAYHGCLKEEAIIGSDYRVDLEVVADLTRPAQSDALSETVDYVTLHQIIKEEMAVRSTLLEHVAQRMADRIFTEEAKVIALAIKIAKTNPPLKGDVESVAIILEAERPQQAKEHTKK